MSLRVDDRKHRSRSKSPGRGRERSRSHSHVRSPSSAAHHYAAADAAGATPQYDYTGSHQPYAPASSESITMGNWADLPPEERPGYVPSAQYYPTSDRGPASPTGTYAPNPNVTYAPSHQYGYTAAPANQTGPTRTPSNAANFQYAPAPDKITFTAKPVVANAQPPPAVRHAPSASSSSAGAASQYQQQQPYYTSMPQAPPAAPAPPPPGPAQHYPPPPIGEHSSSRSSGHHRSGSTAPPSASSGATSTYGGHKVVEMVPGGGGKINAPPSPGLRPHSLSVGGGGGGRPDGFNNRMERLSVSGNRPDIQTLMPGGLGAGMPGPMPGALPPGSPLLEAYHGTYQSISPMPQAMMLDDDLDHLPPLDSYSPRASGTSLQGGRRRAHSSANRSPSPSRRSKHKDKLALEAYGSRPPHSPPRKEKRVKIYDAEDDALALVDALAQRTPDPDPIIDILPALSHDQMLELRNEYKRHCKVQGRGINIAKHIKMKTSGNFGKIAYVTALGRYESEGYWANFWYQSRNAQRELLIEALMGRSNFEIREIKDAFKDKKYGDSLTKCMDRELKADKFRVAVLLALEGEKQEESDVWGIEDRNRDVDLLYKSIRAREGGETAMVKVVVTRSDAHLREVLRTYERKYQGSFARDALRKSNNLVGEVIAHILNGVINRPARDAMLLHHALSDLIDPASHQSGSKPSSKESSSKHERQQRYELLISRLVRLHWDRMHLARVKTEYEDKYGTLLEEDIEEATKGDFREFCLALCQSGR